jgi:hypothetical protein
MNPPSLAILAWTLSMVDIMRSIMILRKYSSDGDIEAAMFRILKTFFRLRMRVLSAIHLCLRCANSRVVIVSRRR